MRIYTRNNRERINSQHRARRTEATRARERAWKAKNREKVLGYKRAHREKNPESYRWWKSKWVARNRERRKMIQRRYYQRNKYVIRKRARAQYAQNLSRSRERARNQQHRRRAMLRGGRVEKINRMQIYLRDIGICGICGREVNIEGFEIDHVIPLARGGGHTFGNVQIAHVPCNRAKGARLQEIIYSI